MRHPLLAALLPTLFASTIATATLVAPATRPVSPAQQVTGGHDHDRRSSSVFVSSEQFETLAAVSIGWGAAPWRDGYDATIDVLRGSHYSRLGNGWWTTFDTIGAVEVGGARIEAGSWYLGLAVDAEGAFRLLFYDSARAMKARLLPGTTALYTGEVKPAASAPLAFARDSLKEPATLLSIEITAEKQAPTTGKLSIRWGKHELSAPVVLHLAGAK
ncbi:MAG: hypothetical protein JNL90_21485 [Planctomycetes bacterium]|nr:hypothetical protein [Planctomycetota bacterium]